MVNTASRMESSGAVALVKINEATYSLVKELLELRDGGAGIHVHLAR